MSKPVIVYKAAGKTIPAGCFEKISQEKPNYIATVWVDKALHISREQINLKDSPEALVEAMGEIQEAMKEPPVLFYFGQLPDNHQKDDEQPFVVIEPPGKGEVLAVMLEGDFSNQRQEKSTHCDEFFAVQKILIPKFQLYYNLSGQNLERLVENLENPGLKNEMYIGAGRHVVAYIASNSKVGVFNNGNELHKTFPWGWMSNHLGYSEEQKPASTSASDLKARLAARLKSSTASVPNTAATTTTVPVVVPQTETKAETPVLEEKATELFQAPEGLSKKEKQLWYKRTVGFIPPDYKNRPLVARKPGFVPSTTTTTTTTSNTTPTTPAPTQSEEKKEAIKSFQELEGKVKDIAPKHIPTATTAAVKEEEKEKSSNIEDDVALMAPASIEIIQEMELNRLDAANNKIKNPAELAKEEEELPTFTEQVGLQLEDTFHWDQAFLSKLGEKAGVKALVLYAIQCRNAYIGLLNKEEERKKDHNSLREQFKAKIAEKRAAMGKTVM